MTVWLVRTWTHQHADEKAHTLSRRSKNVKKRTKTDEKRMLCKFTFIVDRIWLMKCDWINRRFVKSSSKSKILALAQSIECSLSKTCLVSADLSNHRCQMSTKCSFCGWKKCFLFHQYKKSHGHGKEFAILLLVAC